MWGTQHDLPRIAVGDRFIPTHVGNTVSQFHLIAARAVHPHACGEHLTIPANSVPRSGSSPRMWGTQVLQRHQSALRRFIPTHVGNTSLQTDSHCYPAVHPHACGEHRTEEITQRVEDGSSPRMWGTLRIDLLRIELRRFIPTHVGNTSVGIEHCDIWAVHPHACGEHLKAVAWVDKVDGSSPRMWGTLEGVGSENEAIRFIPTHVGNTVVADMQGFAGSVHPHACGEHDGAVGDEYRQQGSSPRMWGTHLPYRIVFKEEKTPRKIYRLILYSVVRSRGWNATNCSPSNNTGCRRLTPRVWNS